MATRILNPYEYYFKGNLREANLKKKTFSLENLVLYIYIWFSLGLATIFMDQSLRNQIHKFLHLYKHLECIHFLRSIAMKCFGYPTIWTFEDGFTPSLPTYHTCVRYMCVCVMHS